MPFRSVTQLLCCDNYFLPASLPFSTPTRSCRPFLSTRHIALLSFTSHINSLKTSFFFCTSIFISHILSLPVLHSLPISCSFLWPHSFPVVLLSVHSTPHFSIFVVYLSHSLIFSFPNVTLSNIETLFLGTSYIHSLFREKKHNVHLA